MENKIDTQHALHLLHKLASALEKLDMPYTFILQVEKEDNMGIRLFSEGKAIGAIYVLDTRLDIFGCFLNTRGIPGVDQFFPGDLDGMQDLLSGEYPRHM